MQVRKAVLDDINGIANLYIEQFCKMKDLQPDFFQEGSQSKEFIKSIIEDNDSDFLVIMKENIMVGFLLLQSKETPDFSCFIKHKYAYLMDIVISEDDRGKGMGSLLLDEAKKWSKDKQLDYIELNVLSNNNNAIQFYQKHDFKEKSQTMFFTL